MKHANKLTRPVGWTKELVSYTLGWLRKPL
jgi:hypothetical protein